MDYSTGIMLKTLILIFFMFGLPFVVVLLAKDNTRLRKALKGYEELKKTLKGLEEQKKTLFDELEKTLKRSEVLKKSLNEFEVPVFTQ